MYVYTACLLCLLQCMCLSGVFAYILTQPAGKSDSVSRRDCSYYFTTQQTTLLLLQEPP